MKNRNFWADHYDSMVLIDQGNREIAAAMVRGVRKLGRVVALGVRATMGRNGRRKPRLASR